MRHERRMLRRRLRLRSRLLLTDCGPVRAAGPPTHRPPTDGADSASRIPAVSWTDGSAIGHVPERGRHTAHAPSIHSARGEVLRALRRGRAERPHRPPALLVEFFDSYDQRERIASQLRELERKGDGLSHDDRHEAREHVRHAVRPRGHPPADQPPGRHHRLHRGGRRHLPPLQDRRTGGAGEGPGGDHRPAVRGARASPREAQGLQERLTALDRDPSARERGGPRRPSRDRRPVHERQRSDPHHPVEGRATRSSRTPSTRARTRPT